MRFKIFALIAFGIVLALAGAFGTFHYTRALETELASARISLRAFGERVKIPVPARDMAAGERLGESDFLEVEIPVAYLPPNVLRSLPAKPAALKPATPAATPAAEEPAPAPRTDAAAAASGTVAPEVRPPGHLVALSPLQQGAFLFDTEIAALAEDDSGALLPAANGRIFALSLRNSTDFGAALQEGSRVDLFWTRPIGGGKSETRLVANGLRLRQMPEPRSSSAAGNANPAPARFLLEGTIEEASRMLVASQSGEFDILLSDGSRHTGAEIVLIGPNDLERLPLAVREGSGDPGSVPASLVGRITGAGETRERCPTAVIRGGTRSMIEVPC